MQKSGFKNLNKSIIYTDDEINSLPYELAKIYDKRTYCKYYISLIKTKHEIFFTFFYNYDYNAKIIKIDLFFINFSLNFTVNAVFFDDDTMHKIYENDGLFDLDYQLPIILYSFLISYILSTPLSFLALSNEPILKFKNCRSISNIEKLGKKLIKLLKTKFILYFIISFIFVLFFWYYLSIFGAVYKNTQYHLIEDTLFSFGLSFIFPFVFYLMPGIFRKLSLSNPKMKRKWLYNFSKFIQL